MIDSIHFGEKVYIIKVMEGGNFENFKNFKETRGQINNNNNNILLYLVL